MRHNLKKIFASILIGATITVSASNVHASKITVNMPHSIYQTKTSEHLSSGVVHENLLKFTTAGWWNLNILRIDLSDPHTDIQGLMGSKGLSNRERVSSMVEKTNAIAGVNGDFFTFSPVTSIAGGFINKGEIITSPLAQANKSTAFMINELNQATIDYLSGSVTAKNLRTDKNISVVHVNKTNTDFDYLTMLTSNWGEKSFGNKKHKDIIEVVVEDNTVIDVRVGKEPVVIPKSGYVLAVRGIYHQNLGSYQVGDKIELKTSGSPNIEDIKFAIGGGSIVLKNGELGAGDPVLKGNHPRTGIGISQDGKEVILVTIDGRDKSFKGVSQEIFGAIMRDLGAYNALNLDGGGSTAMAVKPLDDNKVKLVNKPSDGAERPVANGVGVFSNAPVGELSYLKVSTDDPNMFIDTTRNFVVKGYDQYHNPIAIDKSKLIFTYEGPNGVIENNAFKAKESGKATITANYDDISASMEVKILGTIEHISTSISSFNTDLNSEKYLPMYIGRDKNGYTANVHPRDISFTTTNNIGKVINGVFHSADTSLAGALTGKIGNGVANILVSVGSNAKGVEGFEDIKNFNFSSYPQYVSGALNLNKDAKEGLTSISLNYDFSGGEATRAAYINFKNNKSGLSLEGVPRKLGLWVKGDNQGSWLRGKIVDSKGTPHTIDFVKSIDFDDWKYVTVDIPSNVNYPITLEQIYMVETNAAKKHSGEILIDGLTAAYPPVHAPSQIPTPSSLKDNKNKSTELAKDGFSIGVTLEPKGLNDLVGYDASAKVRERINSHKVSALIGGVSEEFNKGITNKAKINTNNVYSKHTEGDVSFINLNTSKKGIRSTDASQWNKLIGDLNSITANNIIIFSSSPIFGAEGFEDNLEADLLHTYLVEAREKGKNIFLVHGGSSSKTDLKDGIRYIGLNTKSLAKAEDIYDLSIVEFKVNGSDVTYELKPLFAKPAVKTN